MININFHVYFYKSLFTDLLGLVTRPLNYNQFFCKLVKTGYMNLPQNDPTSGAGAAPPRPGNGTNSAARPAPRPAPRVVRAGLGPPAAPSANSTLSNPLSVIAGAFQGALYQRSKKTWLNASLMPQMLSLPL